MSLQGSIKSPATSTATIKRTTALPSWSPYTSMCWAMRLGTVTSFDTVLALDDVGGNSLFLQLNVGNGSPDGHKLHLWDGTESAQITNIHDNVWFFAAHTFDGTTHRGYGAERDRELKTISSTPGPAAAPDSLLLGNDQYNEGGNFRFAAWKVWDRVLTPQEIEAERRFYSPVHWHKLHLWLPCITAAGNDHLNDLSGNAKTATQVGTWTTAEGPPISWVPHVSVAPRIPSMLAFDAASNVTAGTGDLSWTHTPVGTPRGILVFVVQDADGTDQVSGVTYGGVSMTEVSGSPNLHATGETSAVYAYFLGASIPTGAQTVTVTVTGAATKRAVAYSVTGERDTHVVDTTTILNDSLANPSATLSLGSQVSFCAEAFHSGQNDPSGITELTSWTADLEHDYGTKTAGWYRYNIVASTDVTMGWTQTADDATCIGVAISDAAQAATGRLTAIQGDLVFDPKTGRLTAVQGDLVFDLKTGRITASQGDLVYDAKTARVTALQGDLVYDPKTGRITAAQADIVFSEKVVRLTAAQGDIVFDVKLGRITATQADIIYDPVTARITAAQADLIYDLKLGRLTATQADIVFDLKLARITALQGDIVYTTDEATGRMTAIQGDLVYDPKTGRLTALQGDLVYDAKTGRVTALQADLTFDLKTGRLAAVQADLVYDAKTARVVALQGDVVYDAKTARLTAAKADLVFDPKTGRITATQADIVYTEEGVALVRLTAIQGDIVYDELLTQTLVRGEKTPYPLVRTPRVRRAPSPRGTGGN